MHNDNSGAGPSVKKKTLYIRPIHDDETERLLSLAVCLTNEAITVDAEILEHFDKNTPGVDIKAEYPNNPIEWGRPVYVK